MTLRPPADAPLPWWVRADTLFAAILLIILFEEWIR